MKNIAPAVVASIAFIGIIVSVLPYPMAAKRLPLLTSVIAIILLGIVIGRDLLSGKEGSADDTMEPTEEEHKNAGIPGKVLLVSVGWILGILAFIGIFGFIIGSALYVFLYCRLHEGSWMESSLSGLGVAAFIYLVFVAGLKYFLPKGLLFSFLLG